MIGCLCITNGHSFWEPWTMYCINLHRHWYLSWLSVFISQLIRWCLQAM